MSWARLRIGTSRWALGCCWWPAPIRTMCACGIRSRAYGSSTTLTNLHDHQRDSAGYAEAMWVRKAWTLTAGGRMDWFQNYDGHELHWNGTALGRRIRRSPRNSISVSSIRASGLSRKLSQHYAVSASGFRAFRAPTPNELYRSTQVGNQLTMPNGNLLSERATGWETGLAQANSLGQRAHQLLSHPGQSAHHRGHHQSQFIADFADARESRPD